MVPAGHKSTVGLTGLKSRCCQGYAAYRRLEVEPLSSLSNCRNQFLAAVIGWGPFPCWLLAGGCQHSLAHGFLPSSKPATANQDKIQVLGAPLPPLWPPLLCLLCLPPLFKGSSDYIASTWLKSRVFALLSGELRSNFDFLFKGPLPQHLG